MCPVGVSSEVRLHRNHYANLELIDVGDVEARNEAIECAGAAGYKCCWYS
jgi:hypothetical protein